MVREEIGTQSYSIITLYLTVLPVKTICLWSTWLHIKINVVDDDDHWLKMMMMMENCIECFCWDDRTFDDDDDDDDDDLV